MRADVMYLGTAYQPLLAAQKKITGAALRVGGGESMEGLKQLKKLDDSAIDGYFKSASWAKNLKDYLGRAIARSEDTIAALTKILNEKIRIEEAHRKHVDSDLQFEEDEVERVVTKEEGKIAQVGGEFNREQIATDAKESAAVLEGSVADLRNSGNEKANKLMAHLLNSTAAQAEQSAVTAMKREMEDLKESSVESDIEKGVKFKLAAMDAAEKAKTDAAKAELSDRTDNLVTMMYQDPEDLSSEGGGSSPSSLVSSAGRPSAQSQAALLERLAATDPDGARELAALREETLRLRQQQEGLRTRQAQLGSAVDSAYESARARGLLRQ